MELYTAAQMREIDRRAVQEAEALKRAGLTVTRKREKNGWAALEARL